jgi:hypothetical protein
VIFSTIIGVDLEFLKARLMAGRAAPSALTSGVAPAASPSS